MTSALTDAPLMEELIRPAWRGRLHVIAAVVVVPAGAMLIAATSGAGARACVAIYVASIFIAFACSAIYHHQRQMTRARGVLRRLDHCMIYVLIAGTYTPVCLLGFPARWGVPVLSVVWAGAIAGILMKLFAFDNRAWMIVSYALYPALGWAALAFIPVIVRELTIAQCALVFAGGVLYTVGFPVLLLRRPDPWPRVFGYHEVWHAFTVLACICHFAAVALLVS